MKMKMFICIIVVFSFTSGAVAPSQPVDSGRIKIDSLIIFQAAKNYMDSVSIVEHRELDSLCIVVDSLKQEAWKRKILGRIDIWGPITDRDTLKWWYWLYPNGTKNFYQTTK